MASRIIPVQSIMHVSSCFHVYCDCKTIDTVITSQGGVVERWVNEILLAHAADPKVVVGLNIKCRSPKKNLDIKRPCVSYYDSAKESATMQLCIDNKCLIIQLFHIKEIPQSFKDFLMNPRFTFVGVDEDILKFVSEHRLDFAKTADIRSVSINKWPRRFKQHDLKYLAKQIAEFDMDIPGQGSLSEWEAKILDDKQVQCACIAAYASYKIAKIILDDK